MYRSLFACLLVLTSATALAQPAGKKTAAPPKAAAPEAAAQAQAAPAAETPAPQAPAPAAETPATPAPEAATPPAAPPGATAGFEERRSREQIKQEVLDEVRGALDKQRDEIRDEVRAQVATQTANRALEEEFQLHEERKRLELFELDGYLRLRPELFYNLDLYERPAPDPSGYTLFPTPLAGTGKTQADVNMRWRLEPTLNVSEDVRVRSQIDVLDRVLLGGNPEGLATPSESSLYRALTPTQLLQDSILVRRAWGEVTTPVGQLLFGRMGSQWGLGILTNSGNCLDCDYGDTVDRLMFVTTKIAGHFVVPFLDFVSEGPVAARSNELIGQPFDREQLDDARDYGLAIAKRDTDLEIQRKLGANRTVLNYGLYFYYRTQRWDQVDGAFGGPATATTPPSAFIQRDAQLYVPDVWAKVQSQKLRLEFEFAGVFGSIGNAAFAPNASADESQSLTLQQFGGAAQGGYKALDALDLNLELGFASGDRAPGMGYYPGRGGGAAPQQGDIEGRQFCLAATCQKKDSRITNFRFNRDYRVDLILWREIFQGVTDAIYVKPGVRYEVTEGLALWANIIYSRAVYGESTPSAALGAKADPNLGVELDAGVRYESGDGFLTGVSYGLLLPLSGLRNVAQNLDADTAHAIRGWFAVRY